LAEYGVSVQSKRVKIREVVRLLTSLNNPLVKRLVALQSRKGREAAGEFIMEGKRAVEEALSRKAPIKQLVLCPDRLNREDQIRFRQESEARGIDCLEVDEKVCRKISDTENPQGVLAVLPQQTHTWSDFKPLRQETILFIDGVQDPGNLGTILRTALAAGVVRIGLTAGTAELYNPKVVRSSMSAIVSQTILTDLRPEAILDFCRREGLPLIAADARGEAFYHAPQLSPPLALVVGNEAEGLSPCFLETADALVQIPMRYQVESLNVSIAVGILLYEIARRQDFLE
jgi:TrmH family RNA methyltransferase